MVRCMMKKNSITSSLELTTNIWGASAPLIFLGGKVMGDFEIVNKDSKIDTCYGLETFHITEEEINALLSGKKLYSTVNCGEYAITIEMAEI